MKKTYIAAIKNAIRKFAYVMGVLLAYYGFWGSFFPDLTLVEGTHRIVGNDNEQDIVSSQDAEQLYADILEGKYRVTFSSKLWELIKNRYGHGNDEQITK